MAVRRRHVWDLSHLELSSKGKELEVYEECLPHLTEHHIVLLKCVGCLECSGEDLAVAFIDHRCCNHTLSPMETSAPAPVSAAAEDGGDACLRGFSIDASGAASYLSPEHLPAMSILRKWCRRPADDWYNYYGGAETGEETGEEAGGGTGEADGSPEAREPVAGFDPSAPQPLTGEALAERIDFAAEAARLHRGFLAVLLAADAAELRFVQEASVAAMRMAVKLANSGPDESYRLLVRVLAKRHGWEEGYLRRLQRLELAALGSRELRPRSAAEVRAERRAMRGKCPPPDE